jgi:hypothetical protein
MIICKRLFSMFFSVIQSRRLHLEGAGPDLNLKSIFLRFLIV